MKTTLHTRIVGSITPNFVGRAALELTEAIRTGSYITTVMVAAVLFVSAMTGCTAQTSTTELIPADSCATPGDYLATLTVVSCVGDCTGILATQNSTIVVNADGTVALPSGESCDVRGGVTGVCLTGINTTCAYNGCTIQTLGSVQFGANGLTGSATGTTIAANCGGKLTTAVVDIAYRKDVSSINGG